MTCRPHHSVPQPAWEVIFHNVRHMEPGTVVTYAQLSQWVGTDIRRRRDAINKCHEELLKHKRALINQRGTGYKIAHPEEHLHQAKHHIFKGSKQVRKATDLVVATDVEGINAAERPQALNHIALFQRIGRMIQGQMHRLLATESILNVRVGERDATVCSGDPAQPVCPRVVPPQFQQQTVNHFTVQQG